MEIVEGFECGRRVVSLHSGAWDVILVPEGGGKVFLLKRRLEECSEKQVPWGDIFCTFSSSRRPKRGEERVRG